MIRIALLCMTLFCPALLAQDIPDLSKAFADSQLLTKTVKGAKKTFYFATAADFIDLKAQLIKAVGKDWVEVKEKSFKEDKGTKENERARKAMGDSISFSHPKNATIRLTMSIFNTPAFGKPRTMLVTMASKK